MDNFTSDKSSNETPLQGVWGKGNCQRQYTWGDGCYGWEFIETDELSVKQELMPEGTAEQLHYHEKAEQFFFILAGRARFEVDGEEIIVKQNQGIRIEPGQKHRISNAVAQDLEFILYSKPSTKNDRINC